MAEKIGRKALFMGIAQKGRGEEKPDPTSLERLTSFAAGCSGGMDIAGIKPDSFPDDLKPLANALLSLCTHSIKEQAATRELRAIFQENPIAMAIKDRSGSIIEKNPAYEVMMSLHSGGIQDASIAEKTVQGDEWSEAFSGRHLVRSRVEIGPEGGDLTVAERYGIPVERDGDTVAKALFVYRDLTEERAIASEMSRLQHRIGELESLKEGILQGGQLPAVLVDHRFHVIQVNDAFARLTGKSRSELPGKTLPELGFGTLGKEGTLEVTLSLASENKFLSQYAIPIRQKDQEERFLMVFHDKTREREEFDRIKAELEKAEKNREDAARKLESVSREREEEKIRFNRQVDEMKGRMSGHEEQATRAMPAGPGQVVRTTGQGSGPAKEKIFDVVEFELGGERYALDIGFAREIVEMMPITPIPRSPPFLRGIMNLRGEITNIININTLLGVPERHEDTGRKIIVLSAEATGGENIGIIVDDVHSVIQVGESEIEQLGEGMAAGSDACIKGIIKIDSRLGSEKKGEEARTKDLVIWIDMEKVIRELVGGRPIA